jgi:hypothetical protein
MSKFGKPRRVCRASWGDDTGGLTIANAIASVAVKDVQVLSPKVDILIARICSSRKLSNLHAKPFIAGRYHSCMLDIVFRHLADGGGGGEALHLS